MWNIQSKENLLKIHVFWNMRTFVYIDPTTEVIQQGKEATGHQSVPK